MHLRCGPHRFAASQGKDCRDFCLQRQGALRGRIDDIGEVVSISNHFPRRIDDVKGNVCASPAYLLSYTSQFTTLRPGNLVLTGTPGGAGMGMFPPRQLQTLALRATISSSPAAHIASPPSHRLTTAMLDKGDQTAGRPELQIGLRTGGLGDARRCGVG